jgi:CheY-like chemotaxis protein
MNHILIVEDYPCNMRLIEQIIRENYEHYNIIKAVNGKEAIEKAAAEKCRVVLMDVALPDIDGIEVTRRLKESLHYKDVPVIAVTAYAMTHDKLLFSQVFDDYVSKPIDEEKLLQVLRKWIGVK